MASASNDDVFPPGSGSAGSAVQLIADGLAAVTEGTLVIIESSCQFILKTYFNLIIRMSLAC
jgi:hypothetical protein